MAGLSVLRKITCGDICRQRKGTPVIIDSRDTVAHACQILASAAISSAPVFNKADHSFEGFFDYADVMALVLKVFEKSPVLTPTPTLSTLLGHQSLGTLPADIVTDLARKHAFEPVKDTDTLDSILPRFKGFHRLPVTDINGSFIGVVSQSDITQVLYQNRQKIPAFLGKTLEHLNMDRKPVISVGANATLLDALKVMQKHSISSVPIVESNHIIMVLSMSDLKRLFKHDLFSDLQRTCEEYKSQILRAKIFEDHESNDQAPYFGVSPTSSLESVVGKMVATRAHRVFVVESHKPVGIVSLSDVISCITSS